jgi:hypothetical protein
MRRSAGINRSRIGSCARVFAIRLSLSSVGRSKLWVGATPSAKHQRDKAHPNQRHGSIEATLGLPYVTATTRAGIGLEARAIFGATLCWRTGLLTTFDSAVVVRVNLRDAAAALSRPHLRWVLRAAINAVRRAVTIQVRFLLTAAARERVGLAPVRRTLIPAIGRGVSVHVAGLERPAAALTRLGLERICRAQIVAVRNRVAIAVRVGCPTTAVPCGLFRSVIGARIQTIRRLVPVGVDISGTAATNAGIELAVIKRALVQVSRTLTAQTLFACPTRGTVRALQVSHLDAAELVGFARHFAAAPWTLL